MIMGYELDEQMRNHIKRSVGDTPTNVMRYWLRLCHSCTDVTSPIDGGPHHLWLTEESLADAFEIADEIDAEFSKLKDIASTYASIANHTCDRWDNCEYCPFGRYGENMRRKCELGVANDALKELGIEIKDGDEFMAEREGWNEQGH